MSDEMANYPGLHIPDNSPNWHVRKRTPKDLRQIEKRESIRRSLGTADKREAIRRYPLKLAEIEAGFAALREEIRAKPVIEAALATGRIEELGRAAIEGLVENWWSKRSGYRTHDWIDGQTMGDALREIADDERLNALADREGRDLAGDIADQLLVEAGAASRPHRSGSIKSTVEYPIVARETLAYRQLRALVGKGLEYEASLARDQLTGADSAAPHAIFNPKGAPRQTARKTLGDLVREYRKERERLHGVESTARKFGLLFRILEEQWSDDLPLNKITRESCVNLIGFIQRLPANGSKKFPRMTLEETVQVAEQRGHKLLSPNTVGSYVQNLCALLRWGERQGYGVEVNLDGLKPKAEAEVQRRGYEPEEMKKLFSGLVPFRESEPHKFWVPALAAFTGARAEEICQLRTEDVIRVAEVNCLNLTRFDTKGRAVAGKRFKNTHSERVVPLHRELLAAGFLSYVENCPADGRLFDALKPGAKGNYSHNLSKWFGRYKKTVGFDDPALVFHSFRHGFRDACRDADIPEETAHALGGWATINQGQRYGNRGAVKNLHRALQKIGYEDFSLADAVCP
ncbi:site-specific integrase [Qipengyuania seohaensis]|uniref:site-specific integrase n=1 Tax=Qipengyuania seohaensis TaxID=266951 RepID=UPI000C226AF5|nr:site-specific integrase [Qipengyuania seohaensis]